LETYLDLERDRGAESIVIDAEHKLDLRRVVGPRPALVRVVLLDRRHGGRCRVPEVLLVDDPFMADLERLNSRNAVVRRPGHRGEAADHHSLHDVVPGALGPGRSLGRQDAVVVAVVRLGPSRVAGGERFGNDLSDGAGRLSVFIPPGKPVLLALGAQEFLSVLVNAASVM